MLILVQKNLIKKMAHPLLLKIKQVVGVFMHNHV